MGIERVFDGKNLVAIIIRAKNNLKGTNFLTDPTHPLQLGIHNIEKTKKVKAHNHSLPLSARILGVYEYLFVVSGNIKINLQNSRKKTVANKKLSKNDSILIMNITHAITFGKNSKVIEIRQGPYQPK